MKDAHTKLLISNTYTKAAAHRRFGLLKEFLEHRFYTEHGTATATRAVLDEFLEAKKDMAKTEKDALLAWGDEFYNSFTRENMNDQLGQIMSEIEMLPSIRIYIPVALAEDELASIGQWFRKHVAGGMLMDVHIDPTLVSGCGLVWNGTYHDFSFWNFVNKKRPEIAAMVHDYGST